jgi:FdhD protein
MVKLGVNTRRIYQVTEDKSLEKDDLIIVEEPLEIRIGFGSISNRSQKKLVVTLRTPGHDFELALGFIFSEGIIDSISEVESVKYCEDVGKHEEKGNVVRVELSPDIAPDFEKLERNFYMNSSCGVCGKTSIDSVKVDCSDLDDGPVIDTSIINGLIDVMEEKQRLFEHTGGIHAAALFDKNGNILLMREDIGRHNAVDKVIGASLLDKKIDFNNSILLLSGRAGFELIQKAIRASICIVAAVGAPSSLSVNLADEFKQTLIGFLKKGKFNIYTGPERISLNNINV